MNVSKAEEMYNNYIRDYGMHASKTVNYNMKNFFLHNFYNNILIRAQCEWCTDVRTKEQWLMCGYKLKEDARTIWIVDSIESNKYKDATTGNDEDTSLMSIEELNAAIQIGLLVKSTSKKIYKCIRAYDISDTVQGRCRIVTFNEIRQSIMNNYDIEIRIVGSKEEAGAYDVTTDAIYAIGKIASIVSSCESEANSKLVEYAVNSIIYNEGYINITDINDAIMVHDIVRKIVSIYCRNISVVPVSKIERSKDIIRMARAYSICN